MGRRATPPRHKKKKGCPAARLPEGTPAEQSALLPSIARTRPPYSAPRPRPAPRNRGGIGFVAGAKWGLWQGQNRVCGRVGGQRTSDEGQRLATSYGARARSAGRQAGRRPFVFCLRTSTTARAVSSGACFHGILSALLPRKACLAELGREASQRPLHSCGARHFSGSRAPPPGQAAACPCSRPCPCPSGAGVRAT